MLSLFSYYKNLKSKNKIPLGRWTLKHNCKSEDIIVHHTNRDHCGDVICGNPLKYKEYTDEKKN
jgi:hypothetical protein